MDKGMRQQGHVIPRGSPQEAVAKTEGEAGAEGMAQTDTMT